MNRDQFLVILFVFVLAGCSGVHPSKMQSAADSTHSTDTIAHVADTTAPAAAISPAMALSYEERQGSVVFAKYCAVCHGQEGKGDGFNAFNLDPRPRDLSDSVAMKSLSDDQILRTISGGGRSVNKSPLMPAYGWTLDTRQVHYVTAFIRTLSRSTP